MAIQSPVLIPERSLEVKFKIEQLKNTKPHCLWLAALFVVLPSSGRTSFVAFHNYHIHWESHCKWKKESHGQEPSNMSMFSCLSGWSSTLHLGAIATNSITKEKSLQSAVSQCNGWCNCRNQELGIVVVVVFILGLRFVMTLFTIPRKIINPKLTNKYNSLVIAELVIWLDVG